MNVKEANELIAHASELVDFQVSKRGLLESQLFPVTAYICVSFYNSYDMLYEVLKRYQERQHLSKWEKTVKKFFQKLML